MAAPSPSGGAQDLSAEDIIRRHLPPVYAGKGWSAIIAGLAAGDAQIQADARAAFDEIFVATAGGKYLDRLGSGADIQRPADVGMQDADYRQLITLLETRQVTEQALWDLLAVFYGQEGVAAYADASAAEPYALQDGWTLLIDDTRKQCTVAFAAADFQNIAQATAFDACVAITAACVAQDFGAYAQPHTDPETGLTSVRIIARQRGLSSKLRVSGGFAQNIFGFPLEIGSAADFDSTSWSVTIPSFGVTRFNLLGTGDPAFADLRAGDYAIVSGAGFQAANRGTLPIVAVGVLWNGSSYDQHFDVAMTGVAQGAFSVSTGDVTLWRPRVSTVATSTTSPIQLVETAVGWRLSLPATSPAVVRGAGTAAYLQPRVLKSFSTVVQTADGVALVTGSGAHGLTPGQSVLLDVAPPTLQAPLGVAGNNATTGNPGTTSVSQMTSQISIRSDVTPARVDAVGAGLISGSVLVTGGQNTTSSPFPTLADCYLFKTTAQAVLSSGNGRGRTQYTYNWAAATALPSASCLHTLTGLVGLLAGKALLVGGAAQSAGVLVARATNKALIYDEGVNTWTAVPNGTATTRWGHTATRLTTATGDDVVYLAGGQTNPTTATGVLETFRTTGGGTMATVLTETLARCRHGAAALTATTLIVSGGATSPTGLARNDCLVYDEIAAGVVSVGPMGLARKDHLLVQIGDGQVLAIGGIGRDVTSEDSDRLLAECEILDLATKSWRPAAKMRLAIASPTAYVAGGKVYVTSGMDLTTRAAASTETYDIATGTWYGTPGGGPRAGFVRAAVGDTAYGQLRVGGASDGVPTGVTSAFLLIPGADVVTRRHAMPGIRTVATVPTSSTWTFNGVAGEVATHGGFFGAIVAEPFTAQSGVFPGPFAFDPAGLAITGSATTTTMAIRKGGQYGVLGVASTAGLPESGWLVFAFGTAEQIGPVPYLGKLGATQLLLDASYAFPGALALGAPVVLLAGRTGFVPAADNLGAFYLTDSVSGRLAAIDTVLRATAAGLPYEIVVLYPSDVGLGGEGYPAEAT